MTYKICYRDSDAEEQRERDATPEEAAEIDARKEAANDITPKIAAAIGQTYSDVDAVYSVAIGNRATEYAMAEDAALAYRAAGYAGDVSEFVSGWAQSNPTGQAQSNQWAADAIIAQANGLRAAQLAMRNARFEKQRLMRAAANETELNAAVAQWAGFINQTRIQLGLPTT